ncbi:MAG: hypothetical protein V4687_15980 [Bacteroidota bacterium]
MKTHLIILYAVLIGCIGLSIFAHINTEGQIKTLLEQDSTQTANFKKLDSTRSVIEVRTVTRTIKLKQSDAKDDKIDQAQRRILDSLNFDPDQLPNF